MNEHEPLFSHPHDHFNLRHITTVPNTCFVLMPFESPFTIVFETITKALKGLMICKRADDLLLGKPILERILTGIRSAELIIADLTGKNANVFYELGLAHVQTKNVLLLAQSIDDIPFDLRGFSCQVYSTNSTGELNALARIVRHAAKDVRAKAVPTMLESKLDRTQHIVNCIERQLDSPRSLKDVVIRIQAHFSSFSNIGYPDSEDPLQRKYGELLEKERDGLKEMIKNGAILQAIIHPPSQPGTIRFAKRWQLRFDKLLEFLQEENEVMNRSEFVISTEEGTNLLFFGEDTLFEGYKTEIEGGGFGWTVIYTDKDYLKVRLRVYEMLFQSAREHTLKRYGPPDSQNTDAQALKQAVINAVKMAKEGVSEPRRTRQIDGA